MRKLVVESGTWSSRLGIGFQGLELVVLSWKWLMNLGVGCQFGNRFWCLGICLQIWEFYVKSGNP